MASIKRISASHCGQGTAERQVGQGQQGQIAQALAVPVARTCAPDDHGRKLRRRLLLSLTFGALATVAPVAPVATAQQLADDPAETRADQERMFAEFLTMVQEDDFAPQVPPEGQTAPQTAMELPPIQKAADPAAGTAAEGDTADGETATEAPLPAPPNVEQVPTPEGEQIEALALADVVASLYRSYPDINRARQLRPLAGGELLAAYGSYDTKFEAESLSEPTGFYENYRNGLGVARQTWWGGYLSAGYRIGRGFYQPWYKERQTDDAGEFKVGVGQPLLQGRAIDLERVAVFQASLAQQAAGPQLQQAILEISAEAIEVYWDWVAAGLILEAQKELLALAEERGEQFQAGFEAGKFAEIDLLLNQQLIAERRAMVLKSEQKFQATAFKLGLFLRNEAGQPLAPQIEWLPKRFPIIEAPPEFDLPGSIAAALDRRPEPAILQFEMQQVQWDQRLASNQMLPNFDFVAEASQDMGAPATKSDDKGQFELVIGFRSDVPIQRRKARGKIQSTSAKIIQINEKLRLTRDKIATDLQIAANRLLLATQVADQSELALRAALETLERYTFAFKRGKIDLISLNLLEVKANESEIKLVEAQREWFVALASLQLALGLDPLDQAVIVSSLPPSTMPGPGNLPEIVEPDEQAFDQDWQRRNNPANANGNNGADAANGQQ